jgi:LacI family transcriptional regulator
MAVTLRQIADAAGVDTSVVSRVINHAEGNIRVSETRARHIRDLAHQMGYRPNAAARAMSRRRFGAVGLLMSTDPFAAALAPAAEQMIRTTLSAHDLTMVVGEVPDEKLTSRQHLPRIIREWSVDGLLINYGFHVPQQMHQLVDRYRLPSIWINSKHDHDCVYPDDFGGARLGTEYLLKQGHKRISYIGPDHGDHYSRLDRVDGYLAAMAAAGLTPHVASTPEDDAQGDMEAHLSLFHGKNRATAIITNRPMEIALVAALQSGLRLGRDVSLVGIADTYTGMGDVFEPTIARLPTHEMGRAAVMQVMAKIAGPRQLLPPIALEYDMRAGNTTGPPPQQIRPGQMPSP